MINGAPISQTGRVAVDTTTSTPVTFNGALGYNNVGALCISTLNGAVSSFNGGFAFVGKRLKAVDIGAGALPATLNWNQGLPTDATTGELVCTSTAPVVQWNHGWPQAANGAVCIEANVVPTGPFSSGFDNGYQNAP